MSRFCVLRALLESTIIKKIFFLKSMILSVKLFLEIMILIVKFFLKTIILNEKVFVKSMILNKNFLSCQILDEKFFFSSDFEPSFLQQVRLGIENFETRRILKRNNLPKSTTCTFHIAFLDIIMYSYRPQYLRQLDNSLRLRSNNTFCTLFRKDFHF